MQRSDGLFSALAEVSRRDFMKLCTALAATMGLSSKAGAEMTAALTEPKRPPVLWIGAQECTGCTESLLRATHPTVENLVLEMISLEYHETLSAASGNKLKITNTMQLNNIMENMFSRRWIYSGKRRRRLLYGSRQTDCRTHPRSS